MTARRAEVPSATDLVERAVFLLRNGSAELWAVQAAGAVPLLLAMLYFFFDMTADSAGNGGKAEGSLLCAVCYLWSAVCRVRFSQLLMRDLENPLGCRPVSFRGADWVRFFEPRNLALQSCRLYAIPLSAVALIPLAHTVAFFRTRPISRVAAGRLAGAWPRQTWFTLALLALVAVVVFLNIALLLAVLPSLVQLFSGAENEYTRVGTSFNGTVLAVAAGLTWLLMDPLYQAVFCVRAFLAQSRETGLDLMVALRNLALGLVLLVSAPHAGAQTVKPETQPRSEAQARISAAQLDAGVERVLSRREYAWRIPRTKAAGPGFLESSLQSAIAGIRRFLHWIAEQLGRLFGNNGRPIPTQKPAPLPKATWSVIALIVLLAAVGAYALLKILRTRKAEGAVAPMAAARAIRLEDESVSASDLPEREWMELGNACLARGEHRLALRAFYLANLAWLGSSGLLQIAAFKSNLDYRRELSRRTRSEELQSAFGENVRSFERGWYGVHGVDAQQVEQVGQALARMRAYVEA